MCARSSIVDIVDAQNVHMNLEYYYTQEENEEQKTHQQNIITNKINGKRIRIVRVVRHRRIMAQNINEIRARPCNAHEKKKKRETH